MLASIVRATTGPSSVGRLSSRKNDAHSCFSLIVDALWKSPFAMASRMSSNGDTSFVGDASGGSVGGTIELDPTVPGPRLVSRLRPNQAGARKAPIRRSNSGT